MATFQARVEDYVGTFSDTAALTDWLTAGARKLLDLLPKEKAYMYSTATAVVNDTTTINTMRVLSCDRSGYECREIPPGRVGQTTDANSIWFAIATDPAYVIKDTKVNIYPTGGTPIAHTITYPTVAFGDSTLTGLPNYFEQMVVQYAAIQALEQLLNTAVDVEEDIEKASAVVAQLNTVKQEYERCLQIYFGLKQGEPKQ
jgi:hypothetical protein